MFAKDFNSAESVAMVSPSAAAFTMSRDELKGHQREDRELKSESVCDSSGCVLAGKLYNHSLFACDD